MNLLQLPNEILLLLGQTIDNQCDINALARTNCRLYQLLNPVLYRFNIRERDSTALKWAVAGGTEGTVRKCLAYGAPVNFDDLPVVEIGISGVVHIRRRRKTPLACIAASAGHERILQLLLEHGGDPNGENTSNKTPLYIAVGRQDESMVELLLSLGTVELNRERKHPLEAAISVGSLALVKRLLEAGADLEMYVEIADDLFSDAIKSGSIELVEFIIAQGYFSQSHYNGVDHSVATTGLLDAAESGHAHLVRYFIGLGGDVNARSERGSALDAAVAKDDLDVVKVLLEFGVDTESGNLEGMTQLYWAAGCQAEIMTAFLEYGCDPHATDQNGHSPLHRAAEQGNLKVVEILLNRGCDPLAQDHWGETPFSMAAAYGKTSVLEAFLKSGVPVDTVLRDQHTALMLAAQHGYQRSMAILLDHGASMPMDDTGDLWVLDIALAPCPMHHSCDKDRDALAEFLLRRGAVKGLPTTYPAKILMYAAFHGHLRVARLLLEHGVPPDCQNEEGYTPLMMATINNFPKIAKLLIEHYRVDINRRNPRGETSLFLAAQCNRSRMVKLLIERGAEVDARNDHQVTPLMAACSVALLRRSVKMVQTLLAAGADVRAVDSKGVGALHHAAHWDAHRDIIMLLLEQGANPHDLEGTDYEDMLDDGLGTDSDSLTQTDSSADGGSGSEDSVSDFHGSCGSEDSVSDFHGSSDEYTEPSSEDSEQEDSSSEDDESE